MIQVLYLARRGYDVSTLFIVTSLLSLFHLIRIGTEIWFNFHYHKTIPNIDIGHIKQGYHEDADALLKEAVKDMKETPAYGLVDQDRGLLR